MTRLATASLHFELWKPLRKPLASVGIDTQLNMVSTHPATNPSKGKFASKHVHQEHMESCTTLPLVPPPPSLPTHNPYTSHPSSSPGFSLKTPNAPGRTSVLSNGVRVAVFGSSSSSSHNSSSSISEGFKRPPTFLARSRSSSLALAAAASRSSVNSSALSPENSLREMRKSRKIILNRPRSEFVAKRPSMNDAM